MSLPVILGFAFLGAAIVAALVLSVMAYLDQQNNDDTDDSILIPTSSGVDLDTNLTVTGDVTAGKGIIPELEVNSITTIKSGNTGNKTNTAEDESNKLTVNTVLHATESVIIGSENPYKLPLVLAPGSVLTSNNTSELVFTTVTSNLLLGANLDLSNTGVTAGEYTNSSITVDDKGRLTSASNGGAVLASSITALNAGGASYSTVQDYINIINSAGYSSGGNITDNLDGTVQVAFGEGFLRSSNSTTADCYFVAWPTVASIALTDTALNYIYVEWNAGTPQVAASTTIPNANSEFLLGTVHRDGTTLHITNESKHEIAYQASSLVSRMHALKFINREQNGGCIITETGTRNIYITEGRFWIGITDFTIPTIDTSVADTFTYYYNPAAWTAVTAQTQIDNLQYDNDGVLATLGNQEYGVHWVYKGVDGDTYVIYGTGSYSLTEAEEAGAPSNLPPHFDKHALLVGKITIQKSSATFQSIISAFDSDIVSATISVNQVNGIGTDNAVVRFDTNGNTIQNSSVTISDDGTLDTGATGTVKAATISPGGIGTLISITAGDAINLNAPDVTCNNNLTVTGDLTVNGTTTTINTATLEVEDSTILTAHNNPADTIDSAYFMEYNDGVTKYAGLVRDASDKDFYLFQGLTAAPVEGTTYSSLADLHVKDLNVGGLTCSSTTKGFFPPPITTVQVTDTMEQTNGGLVYDTDTKTLKYYNGTEWFELTKKIYDVDVPTGWINNTNDGWKASSSSDNNPNPIYAAWKCWRTIIDLDIWRSSDGTYDITTGEATGTDTFDPGTVAINGSWNKLQFAGTRRVTSYRLYSLSSLDILDWTVYGSTDDITYTSIDSQTGATITTENDPITWVNFMGEYTLSVPADIRFFVLHITKMTISEYGFVYNAITLL